MAVLWYLLSWRGQKQRIQPETERQYRLRGPHHCGLGCFKSSNLQQALNARINGFMHTYGTVHTKIHECTHKNYNIHIHIQTSSYRHSTTCGWKKCFSSEDELMKSKLVFWFYRKGMLVIECGNVMAVFIVLVVEYLVWPLCWYVIYKSSHTFM